METVITPNYSAALGHSLRCYKSGFGKYVCVYLIQTIGHSIGFSGTVQPTQRIQEKVFSKYIHNKITITMGLIVCVFRLIPFMD